MLRSNFVNEKILPDSCINCSKNCAKVAKLQEKIKEKEKTIRRLRQQNARLVSYFNDMAGKIEQFKVELKNLTEKSLEKTNMSLETTRAGRTDTAYVGEWEGLLYVIWSWLFTPVFTLEDEKHLGV
ncbi:hypothetical protein OUZ56_005650 [Daphnia magna]|uniref:Uncharacterized protein n=1 Tax=Daphnia magna TaxID=35525 RepID=A0ABQ9YTC8_9CRUS|nr:hypothetical protein OUZ56_005650 [Daphnia magna]